METVTHLLISLALYRAGLKRLTRWALPILLVSGVVASVDTVSTWGSVETYLNWHYTATHSLLGSTVLAVAVAVVFWLVGRSRQGEPVRLGGALVASLAGTAAHVGLDVAGAQGVQLLWPWGGKRYALDILDYIDPWIVGIIALGLLLPVLFRLVTEEIGAKPAARGGQRGAIVALCLVLVYVGARYVLHQRAVTVLDSRVYRGVPPNRVGAFPSAVSPLTWYGVVETDFTMEQQEFSVSRAALFDPNRSQTIFKPDPSPALEAAQRTPAVRRMLEQARFPSAMVVRSRDGYRVTVEDLRHSSTLIPRRAFYAEVEIGEDNQVLSEELKWGSPRKR